MAGRKRKPTKLHLIQGTAQPCRMNKDEPIAPDEPPRSAVSLPSPASFWYGVAVGRIQSIGVDSKADSEMAMLLAITLEAVEACEKDIAENGRVILVREAKTYRGEVICDKDGKPVETVKPMTNPAVAQLSDAVKRAQSLLAEFGLSPASRGKVSTKDKGKKNTNPFEAFK